MNAAKQVDTRAKKIRALCWLAPGLLVACGAGQTRIGDVFNTEWQNDGGKSIRAVQSKLASHEIPRGADVAVGIVDKGLAGVALETGKTWAFSHAIDARPWIAGDVVVGTGGGEMFALDAETGRKLWSRPTPGQIRGAGDDGQTTLVSLEPSSKTAGMLVAVSRDGTVVRQLEANVAIGSPAVVSNLAFIPWQNQYVTVYDLTSGDEIARAILRHQTSHAFLAGGSLYFGEVGATRFDARIGDAARDQASKVSLPARELPGKPRWMRAGGVVGKTTSDAFDAIRAYALPEPNAGGLGLDGERFYVTYYRIAAGLKDATGELAWVRRLEGEAIGGAAYDGGVALCQRSGEVAFFDASTGATAGQVSFGQTVRVCVVQADSMSRRAETARPEPLVEQISQVIDVTETEMVMMQGFLLRELIAQESPKATQRLIELATDARTPLELIKEVRTGLASRRNGAEYMLAALKQRYDFLAGVLMPPPVGPLSDALAEMKETRAAPLLADHLNDPANDTDDVKRAAMALEKLATPAELDEMEMFLSLYRATAHNDDIIAAVVAVAKAIVRVGGEEGRELVRAAAYDPMTVPSLQEPLRQL